LLAVQKFINSLTYIKMSISIKNIIAEKESDLQEFRNCVKLLANKSYPTFILGCYINDKLTYTMALTDTTKNSNESNCRLPWKAPLLISNDLVHMYKKLWSPNYKFEAKHELRIIEALPNLLDNIEKISLEIYVLKKALLDKLIK
jgi:hypothetical protein